MDEKRSVALREFAKTALRWIFINPNGDVLMSASKPYLEGNKWNTKTSYDIIKIGENARLIDVNWKDTLSDINSREEDIESPSMRSWIDYAKHTVEFKWLAVGAGGYIWGITDKDKPEPNFRQSWWDATWLPWYSESLSDIPLEMRNEVVLGRTYDKELIDNWDKTLMDVNIHITPRKNISELEEEYPNDLTEFNFEEFMNTQTISWNEYLNTIPADNKSENVIINENLSGVEFTPADNLNEYSFEECDLSGTKGLSVKHIEEADGFSKCNMPAEVEGFTVEKAKELGDKFDECTWPALELQPGDNLKGIDLTAANISRFKGLTPEILASANGYAECVTPAMEIKPETDFSKISLQDLDMRHWKGLTVEHLNQTPSFAGAKLPKMNLHGLQTKGRSLYMVDFGEAYGLTWAMCKESKDLAGAKLPIMRIPVEKEKFVEDSPATRQAIKEKRQPAKTVVEDMDMGDTDVMGCDFSKVQGLKELQVEKIRQFGGIGARVELSREQEQSLRSKQQAIGQMAREIAEIVHPMPPDSDKVRYRCPNWLNPIAQSMAWFCKENKIEHSKLANLFAKAEPDVVRSGFAQVKADWLLAKKAGLTVEEFTQKGFAVEKAPEVDR